MENNETQKNQSHKERGGRKGFPLFGFILVFIGIIILLQNFGLLSSDIWAQIWQFWPVILILIGINMLLGRRSPITALFLIVGLIILVFIIAYSITPQSNLKEENFVKPLGDLKTLDARIEFGAGDITISSLEENSLNLIEAKLKTAGGAKTSYRETGAAADLSISMEERFFFFGAKPSEWNISFSRLPELSLDFDSGASNINLDLADLKAKKINLNIGAADANISMPARAGLVDAEISAGAASLDITVPEGVSAKIKKETGVSSFTVDKNRFPGIDGTFISPDFDAAQNRLNLIIKAGAASVNVK